MSGSCLRKSASRGISHFIAKVGPTPMVSTRTLGGRGDLRGEACERIEDRRQPALIGAAGGGGDQAVGLALEQRHAEPIFQQMHHPADRRRRDVELGAGRGKAAAAGRGLERLDAVEKEQPPQILHPQEN